MYVHCYYCQNVFPMIIPPQAAIYDIFKGMMLCIHVHDVSATDAGQLEKMFICLITEFNDSNLKEKCILLFYPFQYKHDRLNTIKKGDRSKN